MNSSAGAAGPGALFNPDDLACPICVETIEDAFATPCGHTFCFKCISTHLKNKSTCPSCGAHLVQDQIHPNFLLNKVRCVLLYQLISQIISQVVVQCPPVQDA
jgi:E3 ubiquitin-protein ligase RFWD2